MTYVSPTAQPRLANYLEASANTVGLLITGEDEAGEEEAVHVWLPLGKRAKTREFLAIGPYTLASADQRCFSIQSTLQNSFCGLLLLVLQL